MTRRSYAQVSTHLFADPKVRRLWRCLDDRDAYAAVGLWLDTLCAAWAAGDRHPSALELGHDDLVACLVKSGMLDAEGRIPEATWAKWWGPVEDARKRQAERVRKHRQLKRDVTVTDGDAELPYLLSSHLISSTGETKREGVPSGDAGIEADDPYDIYEQLTGRYPTKPSLRDWLTRLARDHPAAVLRRVMVDEWTTEPTSHDFLSRVEERLVRSKDVKRKERKSSGAEELPKMSEEQRLANLAKLGEMMAETGLLKRKDT